MSFFLVSYFFLSPLDSPPLIHLLPDVRMAAVKDQVASAVYKSLVRIAAGGTHAVVASSLISDVGDDSKTSNQYCNCNQWLEELKLVAEKSVSFSNGNITNGLEGKPHDVEVRAALTLYHRIRRVYRKRKQQHNSQAYEDSDTTSFEVISDFGTQRSIDSVQTLANILTIELETELSNIQTTECDKEETVSFTNIKSDNSGIICLVSKRRSEQLHNAGRLPCSHCTKWFKGTEGLWWHMLQAHNVAYSTATESAKNEGDILVIVPYQEGVMEIKQTHRTEPIGKEDSKPVQVNKELDAFDMVKMGKYEEFKRLVEEGHFCPKSNLDSNGSCVLLWAAGAGRLNFVIYLIKECKCSANTGQQGKRSFLGRTPLHWAARNGHLCVVQYLVTTCKVDINATTADGTTAFCWACWQGHLDIMKFLHDNGCDIHSTNSFGCNAVLWSAQGGGSCEIMSWLFEVGLDFTLINSNGHSALHKAAQRGSNEVVHWLVNTILCNKSRIAWDMIKPDTEGHCPSDLAQMEQHEQLAQEISKYECDCIFRIVGDATSVDALISSDIPSWLKQALLEAKTNSSCVQSTGIRRMALRLTEHISPQTTSNEASTKVINNINDID